MFQFNKSILNSTLDLVLFSFQCLYYDCLSYSNHKSSHQRKSNLSLYRSCNSKKKSLHLFHVKVVISIDKIHYHQDLVIMVSIAKKHSNYLVANLKIKLGHLSLALINCRILCDKDDVKRHLRNNVTMQSLCKMKSTFPLSTDTMHNSMELQSEESEMDQYQHKNTGYSNVLEMPVNEENPVCHQLVEFKEKFKIIMQCTPMK